MVHALKTAILLTCQGQFPGLASTPPITRVTGDLPQDEGGKVGGGGVEGPGPVNKDPRIIKDFWLLYIG